MATYPPNQTTPGKGSGNYLWNWLGSSLKKFGAAISPYITGGDPYKKYVALLSQSGTDDPVVTVLENTLGAVPVWTRSAVGTYDCDLTNAFLVNNTFCLCTNGYAWFGSTTLTTFGHNTNDRVTLNSWDFAGVPVDLNNSPGKDVCVEIRIYP